MLTKEDALLSNEFHFGECRRIVGSRGGVKIISEVWRRNGRTRVWKTRPDDYELPLRRGPYEYAAVRYEYAAVRPSAAPMWHSRERCPLYKDSTQS